MSQTVHPSQTPSPGKPIHKNNLISFTPNIDGDGEFRAHRNWQRTISMVNGDLLSNQKQENSGLSTRFIKNGLYGFAAHPDMNPKGAEFVLSQAEKNLKILQDSSQPATSLSFPKSSANVEQLSIQRQQAWTDKDLLDRLQELDQQITQLGQDFIQSRSLFVREQSFDKEVWTGLGGHALFSYARSHIICNLTAQSAQGPVDVMFAIGGYGFIENTFPQTEVFKQRLEEHLIHLRAKTQGVYVQPGKHTVILASKLAGILAHEAVGHTTEADLVLGGSVAGQLLGQQVASPLVSLVDFAYEYKGTPCPVPVYIDDECIATQDTIIIEDGQLKTFMNSRETAVHFDQPATGHARAWGYNDEPLIRMRNTAILPGQDKLEDMIASIDEGYYLLDHSNGQADSTSEFMFGVTLGYEIKKGKLGRALLNTTISGVAFDMLQSVSMISDEMTWVDTGTCGKKQPMYVGMGGPAIKCEVSLGGQA